MVLNSGTNEFDIIIIGGGATGAGTARDCSLRGMRVLLVERFDFAAGATEYENGLLVKYGKELTGSDITGEYIGIGRFSKDFMPEFMEKLDGMIRTQQHSVWWENILYEMVGKRPVYVEEMDGLFWAEVDYVEDYERILRFRGYKADFSLNVEKI